VFTARYALSPYIKQIGFVFKGLKIQFLSPSKHSVSVIKANELMLYSKIIIVCSQIHTKYSAICGQNVGFFKC
jgi:hypothetical protein